MIFLQKSWGLPVTCRSQSVNPAVTYFAFLHNSRVMILLIIVNLGARLRAPHFTVHFSIQKPVSSQQICWKYLSRCFDFFLQKSWGLPVTCCGQSVNPAATYSAFLHSSSGDILQFWNFRLDFWLLLYFCIILSFVLKMTQQEYWH